MRDGAPTKAKIARTALGLFVKQGVTETTIKHIAAAADVAEGTLYRHYAGKDDLAWDLFASHFTGFALELDALQARHKRLDAKLDAMIRRFCDFFDRDRTLFTYLLITQHGFLSRVTPDMPNPVQVLRDVIAAGMTRREARKNDPDVVTAMVLGLVLQVALARIYGRITSDLTPLADTLVAAARRIVRG